MFRHISPRLLPVAAGSLFLALAIPATVRADDVNYELKKNEPKVAVGAKSAASLTIAAKNGWHVNAEAPITMSLVAPAGLTLPKTKLVRADLTESTKEAARFEIPFQAVDAGTKVLNGEARFVVCIETTCKPIKETVSFSIEVAPAESPAPKEKAAAKKKKAS